jgi:uncharacterized protein (TIGR03085 family)
MMTAMTHLARLERDALCATLAVVGPAAPTLCSPWTAADLAAHLVLRDRRPDLAPGIWVPALAARTEQGMRRYAAMPWADLVDLVRAGPPVWSPARVPTVDDLVNFVEFFVHHEDVLRGDEVPGPRRELSDRATRGLWTSLSRSARLMFRRSPVGVVLRTPAGDTIAAHPATALGTVILEGEPGELLLAAYGRRRVAQLAVMGSDEAVSRLWSAPVGLT